jgi:hypothetical protein
MSREIVGEIQGYDVIYVPEKDVVFCKNTTCKYEHIEKALLKSPLQRNNVEDKLPTFKNNGVIEIGCLVTTESNILLINNNIKRIKNERRRNCTL